MIILGGGIYGAALLREAVLRGLSAVLIEKGDFGSGTSANSLKVIHGGIRYLQTLDIKRVFDSAMERKILMKIAPHLVHPMPCITPTFRNVKDSKLLFYMGFMMNDIISFNRNKGSATDKTIPSCKIVSAKECVRAIPGIDPSDITGGAMWYDAQVYNSERLVLSFILAAQRLGADAFNYLALEEIIIRENRVVGIIARDRLNDQLVEIEGKMTVNATGPSINQVSEKLKVKSSAVKQIGFAKAVNFIVPKSLSSYAIGLRNRKTRRNKKEASRLLFFAPWRDTTIIGTWYFPEATPPDELYLTEEELQICMEDVQKVYPGAAIKPDEISFMHIGRVPTTNPIPAEHLKIAENYQFIDHSLNGGPHGIVSVLGVKYTTARNVAERAIRLISKKLNLKLNPKSSTHVPLNDGDMPNYNSFLQMIQAKNLHYLSPKIIKHIVNCYGTQSEAIMQMISDNRQLVELVPGSDEVIKAEVAYSVNNEMVYTLSDLLLRRTDIGSSKKPERATIQYCADFLADKSGWSTIKKQQEIEVFLNNYKWIK